MKGAPVNKLLIVGDEVNDDSIWGALAELEDMGYYPADPVQVPATVWADVMPGMIEASSLLLRLSDLADMWWDKTDPTDCDRRSQILDVMFNVLKSQNNLLESISGANMSEIKGFIVRHDGSLARMFRNVSAASKFAGLDIVFTTAELVYQEEFILAGLDSIRVPLEAMTSLVPMP